MAIADRDSPTDVASGGALDRDAAEALARTFRAVSDPTRLQILSFINGSARGEAMVSEITAYLGLRQPTVSHHLKVMAEDGLLVRRQEGRTAWFSITPERRTAIADLLS
ncbi:metalloregulator ArsR/SmtB family transcription factor [Herbiconiux sp.]|jgi:ArsR family transcriptional regulator|uniref:ArsR/SmtB family transcription factor n=1 Tax=Herbiconiux sp. TaxID=1871186 RepID=UPI0025B7DF85|nr:metalloregulator ArsR/SmtB family transcription factor [Herbiconiux sp.]